MTHVWIQCENGRFPLSQDKLDRLLTAMPILRNLLLGHPEMASKAPVYAQDDKARVLTVPADLNVDFAVMIRLVDFVLEKPSVMPSSTSELEVLRHAMLVLGGCDSLEERFRAARVYNPVVPEDDYQALYDWELLVQDSRISFGPNDARNFTQAGYAFASRVIEGHMALYHFRRPKERRA